MPATRKETGPLPAGEPAQPLLVDPLSLEEEEAERARRQAQRRQRQAERARREEEERQRRLRSETRRERRAEKIRTWREERKRRREKKLQERANEMLRANPGDPRKRAKKKKARRRESPALVRRIKTVHRQRLAEQARKRFSDVVGLDIGASMIRAAFFSEGQAYLYEKQIPEGIIVNGILAEPEELTEELREMWRDGEIASRKVNFSISNRLVVVRAVSLPAEYEEDIEQALALNAAPIVAPMNPDQTVLDYAEMSRVGRQVSLQVAAADIGMSKTFLEAVEEAGLIAVSAEVGSLAGNRSIVIPRSAQQTHGIINIGAEGTTISVASGPDTFFFRSVESGGNDFTAALAGLGLTWPEAERYKQASGLEAQPVDKSITRKDFATMRRAMQPVADNLCQEIVQTQGVYERSETGRGKPIAGYTIIGGGAKLPGLAAQIEATTGRPCSTEVNPWPGLETIDVDFSLWAAAIGLARSNSMSLLPPPSGLLTRNRRRHSKISPAEARNRARDLAAGSSEQAVNPKMVALLAVLVVLLGMFLWSRAINSSTGELREKATSEMNTASALRQGSDASWEKDLAAELRSKPDWAKIKALSGDFPFFEIHTSGSEVELLGPNPGPLELGPGAEQQDLNRSLTRVTIRRSQ